MAAPWLPELVLALGGLAALGLGAWLRERAAPLLLPLSLAAAAASGALAAAERGYGAFFPVLFCALTAGVLLFAEPYARRRGLLGDEFYGLVLWACLGMVLTASAPSWLTLFLGYELLSLCLYVLVALPKGRLAGEAALKYFFVGAVASGFLAFGIAVLYAATGTLDVAASVADRASAATAAAQPWARLGLALLLAAFGFKLALAPFHLWAPDVYQGAPAPVTALLAAGSKVALFAALLRVACSAGDPLWAVGAPTLALLGTLAVVVGNVGALTQPRAKRLLAYSSVAQTGYLVLALSAVRQGGAAAALFYAVAYSAADLGAFGLLGSLSSPEREGDLDLLADLRGMGATHPWRAAAFSVCLLSLAGFPPAAGFIGKLSIFVAVFRAGFVVHGLVALATTAAAAFVYLRLVRALYALPPEGQPAVFVAPKAALSERVAAAAAVGVVGVLGVAPSLVFSPAARVLWGFLHP